MSVLQSMVHAYRYIYYLPTCVRTYVHIYIYIYVDTHTHSLALQTVWCYIVLFMSSFLYTLYAHVCTSSSAPSLHPRRMGPCAPDCLGGCRARRREWPGETWRVPRHHRKTRVRRLIFVTSTFEHAEHCPSPGFTVCGLLGP